MSLMSLITVALFTRTCDVGPEAGAKAQEEHEAGAQAGGRGPDGVRVQSVLTQPHNPDQKQRKSVWRRHEQ